MNCVHANKSDIGHDHEFIISVVELITCIVVVVHLISRCSFSIRKGICSDSNALQTFLWALCAMDLQCFKVRMFVELSSLV